MDERIRQLDQWTAMWVAVGAFGRASAEQRKTLLACLDHPKVDGDPVADYREMIALALSFEPPLVAEDELRL